MRAVVRLFQKRVYLLQHVPHLQCELVRRGTQDAGTQCREPDKIIVRDDADVIILSDVIRDALDIRVRRLAVLGKGDVYIVLLLARAGGAGGTEAVTHQHQLTLRKAAVV